MYIYMYVLHTFLGLMSSVCRYIHRLLLTVLYHPTNQFPLSIPPPPLYLKKRDFRRCDNTLDNMFNYYDAEGMFLIIKFFECNSSDFPLTNIMFQRMACLVSTEAAGAPIQQGWIYNKTREDSSSSYNL